MKFVCPSCQAPFDADDRDTAAPGLRLCDACSIYAGVPAPPPPQAPIEPSPPSRGAEVLSRRDLEPASRGDAGAAVVSAGGPALLARPSRDAKAPPPQARRADAAPPLPTPQPKPSEPHGRPAPPRPRQVS